MGLTTTPSGGAYRHHDVAGLSRAERQAAQNVLDKLKTSGTGIGSHLDGSAQSATVFGGSSVKAIELGASTLIHGQGRDTFVGGGRSVPTNALAHIGSDTVVSGSATTLGGRGSVAGPSSGHGSQHFSLSGDTINIAGATAEGVKAAHPKDATTSAHTITLADKTTITIAGLSSHDITKLQH